MSLSFGELIVADAPAPLPELTPDALRTRFKARCAQTNNVYQNWQIRVHRSMSWLKRAESFGNEQPEAKFLFLWIALNSLYGRWNTDRNAPDGDAYGRHDFMHWVCGSDPPIFGRLLHEQRLLVRKILGNPFLSNVFWRNPTAPDARKLATADANFLDRHLRHQEYSVLLDQVIERVFVLRGQLVHGASTGGSRLNRSTLEAALQMLGALVPLIIHLSIQHGCDDDWPELCYPPVEG